MSAKIVKFPGTETVIETRTKIAGRPPETLIKAASAALRFARFARSELYAKPRGRGSPARARKRKQDQIAGLLDLVCRDLEAGIAGYAADARSSLQELVVDAMGPDVTAGEVNGARNALSLILDALPYYDLA